MERWIRRAGFGATALLALVGVLWISGNRAPIDAVERASEKTGVVFESTRVMVEVDGERLGLHVVLAGPESGPPVLLLHGFPEFWYTWHAQMAVLARQGFRVAAPDTRGTNRSDKPSDPNAYTDAHLTDDVLAILDALDWPTAFVAGHDVGAGTTWQLVLERPDRVRAAIVFNGPHPLASAEARPEDDADSVSWFRRFFRLPFLPELVSRAGDWWLVAYYLTTTSRPGAFDAEELAVFKGSWARDAAMGTMINTYRAPTAPIRRMPEGGRPEVPVRIVWGEQDAFIPLEGAALSQAYLPPGAVVRWPEQTHWLLHEEPERSAQEMLDFFLGCCPDS